MSICELCQGCSKSVEDKIDKESLPLITNAFLILTERCPLACKYCFVSQNPREMTYETALQSVKFVCENAEKSGTFPTVCFFGGEPLVKWDDIIVPIVNYIRKEYKKPCGLNMTTNGVLLTEDKLKFMRENGLSFLLSVDGDKQAQDTNRVYHNGRGSFEDIPLDLILKYFPEITIRGTFDCNTVEYLSDSIRFMHEFGFDSTFFYPNVSGEWKDISINKMRKQLRNFSDYFIENIRNGKVIHHKPLETKINECVKLNWYIDNNMTYSKTGKKAIVEKCGIGVNQCCSISTSGEIYGCQEMPSNYMCGEDNIFMFGDVFNGVNVDKRMKLVETFSVKDIDGTEYGGCDNCRLQPICNSGCSATNFRYSGSFSKPPRMYCEFNNALLDEAEYIIGVLGEERNELFRNTYFVKRDISKGGVVYAE